MARLGDQELIEHTHNTSRFFVEHRQIAWAALVAAVAWGAYGYISMPQRKDPDIPVRVAVASCRWPGATAQEGEQLVTRPIEQTIAENKHIHPATPDEYGIRSISLPGVSIVYVQLSENVDDTREQFSDINLRLHALTPTLTSGATGIQFQSDFSDTAALMMTVASPPIDDLEIQMRARSVEDAIRPVRAEAGRSKSPRISIIFTFPLTLSKTGVSEATEAMRLDAGSAGVLRRSRLISGRGFMGIDGETDLNDESIDAYVRDFATTHLHQSEFDPDVSYPVIIHDAGETPQKLAKTATPKYTYAELDNFTDLIGRALLGAPEASRVERKGVLPQAVYLDYSQERLASYGLQPSDLSRILNARNITLPGGSVEADGRRIQIDPSGKFETARAVGDILLTPPKGALPLYLRNLVRISRGYQAPPEYLNFYTSVGKDGKQRRYRAITLAIYMRSGEQIRKFGASIDEKLRQVRAVLPTCQGVATDASLSLEQELQESIEFPGLARNRTGAPAAAQPWPSAASWSWSSPMCLARSASFSLLAPAKLHPQIEQRFRPSADTWQICLPRVHRMRCPPHRWASVKLRSLISAPRIYPEWAGRFAGS
jgi:multidrug efflux pump subunit AcrB